MDAHDRKARRAQLTLIGLGTLIGAALVGGGITAFLALGGDDTPESTSPKPSASAKPSPSASSGKGLWNRNMTPAKGQKIKLKVPTGQKGGASTGFPHTAFGSISAAVYYHEEYAWLDDQKARQQLEVITSPDATGYIDEQISEVRKLREGAGLPPSGGTPAGLTVTTTVEAVRAKSILAPGVKRGDVVQVWLSFDRYATGPDGGPDKDPIKGDTTDYILKWQDGAWKITNEPVYWKKRTFPVAYDPDSPYAWQDGWWQVRHAD
ncbi:hypothetical protein OG729_10085 [Streptomyces sp. NBC_00210]|uniref:hypothetical protein n=1 Tax=Streptomyces sp. NBC_00210 TaxID=2903636 RepID=UPI0032436F5F